MTPNTSTKRDIIVIGASAGGVEALIRVFKALPASLDAAVFVVQHIPSTATSVLPAILNRETSLPVKHARRGQPIRSGQVLIAPPDHHMMLHQSTVVLQKGPKENSHRPAVDPL